MGESTKVRVMMALPPTRARTESKVGMLMAMKSRNIMLSVRNKTRLHVRSAINQEVV